MLYVIVQNVPLYSNHFRNHRCRVRGLMAIRTGFSRFRYAHLRDGRTSTIRRCRGRRLCSRAPIGLLPLLGDDSRVGIHSLVLICSSIVYAALISVPAMPLRWRLSLMVLSSMAGVLPLSIAVHRR
jgi:hypothetical protein